MQVIGFLGAGNMAEALARGLISGGFPKERIAASDPRPERRKLFSQLARSVFESNLDLIARTNFLVLAVKPQVIPEVLAEIAPHLNTSVAVLSIAAGISLDLLKSFIPENHVIRAMPNTPCLVGSGVSVLFAPREVPESVRKTAENVLASCGKTAWVEREELLDCVTAVSGSGPAYFFLLSELVAQAGERLGLEKELSNFLSRETFVGAASLLSKTGEEASELRKKVTSPGGTTEAALRAFEECGLGEIIFKALSEAASRSKELSELARKAASPYLHGGKGSEEAKA